MFSKNTIDLDLQGVFNTLNFEVSENNRYIQYSSSHSLFIQSDLRFKLIDEINVQTMTHIRNILPVSKTATIQWFDYRLYKGYTKEKLNSIVESTNVGIRSFVGQYLHKTNDMNRLYYDQTAATITTKDGVDIYTTIKPNILNPVMYYGKANNINWMYYITNALGECTLVPDYEVLLYPMECTKHARGLFLYFEKYNNEVLTRTDSLYGRISPSSSINLNRPRFLFSYDNGLTYYKFNTSSLTWELQSPSNGEYFTYNEFISKSNTYSEYVQIKIEKWEALYASNHRYVVLSNNYIYPILIGEKYWMDRLDISDWLQYNNSTLAVSSFMYGTM